MIVLGIDPGLSGALALVSMGDRLAEVSLDNSAKPVLLDVVDMPVLKIPKSRGGFRYEVDAVKLSDTLALWCEMYGVKHACIEDVAAAPGQGVVSMFNFGYGSGLVYGAVTAHGMMSHFVKPAVWKSILRLNRDKSESLDMARAMFGAERFTLKKHDGRAEAALIGVFGLKVFRDKV
jgi:crossover junction endodeoxyribonuclease RuvC